MSVRLVALVFGVFISSMACAYGADDGGTNVQARDGTVVAVALADPRAGVHAPATSNKGGDPGFQGWPVVLMGVFLVAVITTRRGNQSLNR